MTTHAMIPKMTIRNRINGNDIVIINMLSLPLVYYYPKLNNLVLIINGKYNFYDLKLWMTPEAAKKAVGGANETSTTRIGKDYLMT